MGRYVGFGEVGGIGQFGWGWEVDWMEMSGMELGVLVRGVRSEGVCLGICGRVAGSAVMMVCTALMVDDSCSMSRVGVVFGVRRGSVRV